MPAPHSLNIKRGELFMMKTFLVVAIIVLIPLASCLIRNIYRYKKNLPLEDNIYGRFIKFLLLK